MHSLEHLKKKSQKPWISNRHKNIVHGFINKVQKLFPNDNAYYIIVELIKNMILFHYSIIIESNLLPHDEVDKLYNLLTDNNKIIVEYPLGIEGFARKAFVARDHGRSNVLILNESCNADAMFKGYIKTGWDE